MDIFSAFATDTVAESEGRWFPLSKDASVKVARTGNPNYLKSLRQLMQDNQVDTEDSSDANEALVTKLIGQAMAESILLDWKGLKFQGADIAYTKANAEKLLAIKDFRKRIGSIADKQESFRIREEAEQGNV